MLTRSQKEPEKESEAVTYGGYTARKEFEKRKRVDYLRTFFIGAGVLVLVLLAGFGAVGLLRGDFSSSAENNPASSLKVPQVQSGISSRSVEELVETARAYTITLTLEFSDGTSMQKSGFVITSDGYAVTDATPFLAREVIGLSAFITEYGEVYAQMLGADETSGVALIRLNQPYDYVAMTRGNSDYVQSGSEVFAVGDYLDGVYYGCVLSGRVTTIVPDNEFYEGENWVRTIPILYTDFTFNDSCLGAPLINTDGQVIGFCTAAVQTPYRGCGAVIPVNSLMEIFYQLLFIARN